MIIANPIYDVVFKRLMENERVAKYFIGTFLNAKVEVLEVRPQEFTYIKEDESARAFDLTVFRLDFIAVVRMENGETQKILIEIQKASKEVDLMRFRNYLDEQYKKEDEIDGRKEALPIKTIYILGFKLPTIESPCLHIERRYLDMITNEPIEKRSRFIEGLTHDSYVVQVERIGGKHQSHLEQLLTVFEQAHFVDEYGIIKDYPYDLTGDDFKLIVDILHHTGTDPETRKEIETEQEAWRSVNAMFQKRERELLDELEEKDHQLEEKDHQLEQQEEALERQRREIEELKRKLSGNDSGD
ncbi:hypothetical protein [Pontibacter sp. G13]|uniref:hypothetical protein n=1 Tax=Pontibacter sp. G13 TaxID=3074898 RepID=UPI00288A24FD|nr:hypothetical protein [Pontibacter sp. G13]WNJ17952.1 hypothetical protein RJD25_24115 [Pontibacter sp. G13]